MEIHLEIKMMGKNAISPLHNNRIKAAGQISTSERLVAYIF